MRRESVSFSKRYVDEQPEWLLSGNVSASVMGEFGIGIRTVRVHVQYRIIVKVNHDFCSESL